MRRRKRGPSSRDLRTAIRRRIADFDLFALLDLLEFMGYESEEIVFRGHATQVSPPALLHDIEFHTSPGERVVISINFGLLAADSPLPSYFLHVLEQTDVDEDQGGHVGDIAWLLDAGGARLLLHGRRSWPPPHV